MDAIIHGDCLEKLKELADNSVDAICTDPPYGLSFMGKKWDYDVPSVEIWKECLRVLKPGGHLLSFAGTRTQHRMAVNIEDAGFEIRDMIAWVYGSGFPKSLNIGKAVDKLQGNEREVTGEGTSGKPESHTSSLNMSQVENNTFGGKFNITKGTSEWEGYGTALKPSIEPITMARKPLEKGLTVAENCLKWGTGGINIDESRVEYQGDADRASAMPGSTPPTEIGTGNIPVLSGIRKPHELNTGRFPANLIHDNSEEVRECFPETKGEIHNKKSTGNSMFMGDGIQGSKRGFSVKDSGNASRFFKSIIYTAKASKSERNKGCEYLYILKDNIPTDDIDEIKHLLSI